MAKPVYNKERLTVMGTIVHSGDTQKTLDVFITDKTCQVTSQDPDKWWIKGMVTKTDTECGPHITLLSNICTTQLGGDPAEMYKNQLTREFPSGEEMEIDSIVEMSRSDVEKDGTPPYVCLAFHIKPSNNLKEFRDSLKDIAPRFEKFDDWTVHVTIGYFVPEQADNIMELFKICIGNTVKLDALELSVR